MSELLRIRAGQIEWRAVEGEVVILDLARQRFLSLNPSGALLWEALAQGPATRAQLAERLVAAYGIDPIQAAADVEALTESLLAEALLAGPEGAGSEGHHATP